MKQSPLILTPYQYGCLHGFSIGFSLCVAFHAILRNWKLLFGPTQ